MHSHGSWGEGVGSGRQQQIRFFYEIGDFLPRGPRRLSSSHSTFHHIFIIIFILFHIHMHTVKKKAGGKQEKVMQPWSVALSFFKVYMGAWWSMYYVL